MITIIIVVLIVTVVTIFSVQNAMPVEISFFFWRFKASLAIVFFLAVLTGVIIGFIVASLFRMKRSPKKIP